MMGSGKSYWTKFLSKKLKTGGYDLDFLIESNEERTIAEIFAEDGEDYFRKQEAKILRWFKEKNHLYWEQVGVLLALIIIWNG